ncbi:oligosaccharide flippase family protein [Shewanella sp. WPAGA9]|uniref:oligosaccharide flippase family protein n=1 Tax=Shewanella sp. ENK2 TaxID=2775245 RepID=UPI00177BA692|nr:oligosaccharide flippase family protein [Shewanella sp. WPAGA9]
MSKSFYSIIWIISEKLGASFISMTSFFIYAYFLTPTEIGIATMVLAASMGLGQVVGTLFQDPMVCVKKLEEQAINTVFIGGLTLSLLTALLLVLVSFWVTESVDYQQLALTSSVLIPILFLNAIYTALLRRRHAFKSLSQRLLIGKLLGASLGIIGVTLGFGAMSMVIQAILIEFFGLIFLINAQKITLSGRMDFKELINITHLGVSVALRKLSWEGYIKGLPLLIGATLGAGAVGVFAFAWRIVDMPRTALMSGAISYALPTFSAHKTSTCLLADFIKFSKVSMLIFAPLFVGLALVAEPLILTIFGEKWIDAVPIIIGLAICTVVSLTTMYIPTVLTALLTPKTTLKVDILSSVISLLLCYLLIPYLGLYAVVMSILFRSLFNLPFTTYQMSVRLNIPVLKQFTIHTNTFISLFFMSLLVLVAQDNFVLNNFYMLMASIAIGVLIYSSFIMLLEKSFLTTFLRRSNESK